MYWIICIICIRCTLGARDGLGGTDLGSGGGKACIMSCLVLSVISRDVSGVLSRMSERKGGGHIATELRDGRAEKQNTQHRPQKKKTQKHTNVGKNG